MTGEPVLTANGLDVVVGTRRLLTGVSLDLYPGDVVVLEGPSGSGKTSLLRALVGFEPLHGELKLRGRDAASWGWPRFRQSVRLCPQRPTIVPGTVHDNLALGRALATRWDERWLEAALGHVDLALEGSSDASRLSEGERQRLALVRALVSRPEVALLDEPTSSLDEERTRMVERWIASLVEDGLAVVWVSHDAAQIERMHTRRVSVERFRAH